MATNLELQQLHEWDKLRGFNNLLLKESRAWLGTRRWWINGLLWPAMLGALVVYMVFVPTFVSLANPDDVVQAGGDTLYAVSLGLSVFFEFGIQAVGIGVIILCQDLIVDEKQSGVMEWILAKPVARPAYILGKLSANLIFIMLLLIGVPSLLTYSLLSFRMGVPFPWLPFVVSVGIMGLHSLFYLTLTVMLGTFFSSRPPILGLALGVLLGGGLFAGLARPLLYITPWSLSKMAALVANSQPVPYQLLLYPVASTAIWCFVFVMVALANFARTEF